MRAILISAAAGLLVCGSVGAMFQAGRSVVDTPHNLSVSGPGLIRAATEEQVCIFCHTPHNASPVQPLWNRNVPIAAYTVYSSNALDARPDQPTGASKMCLSCHDGTIALGSVVSRGQVIRMASGITTLPPGASNLGTDLSDDHPISFRYDAGLVTRDPMLADPAFLPHELRLDVNRELQCTTCHDPHDNSFTHFLVMSNDDSTLCRACHRISTTTVPEHTDCRSCHRAHTAPSGPYLLTGDKVRTTCLSCHDGTHRNATNIAADLQKMSVHDTDSPVDPPDAPQAHATCADCHDPHTMTAGSARAPAVPPNFGRVSGMSSGGSRVEAASFEYEVCYKCHADDRVNTEAFISRRIVQTNVRHEFATNAISSHPVQAPGGNPDVPSLRPPYHAGSVIYCGDCHGSDRGAAGVHGSNFPPLLSARYETADYTPESASAYALCYTCHDRTGSRGILGDASFPHRAHVQDQRIPCSACHDAHGVSSLQGSRTNNSHLINFDTSIVFPDPRTGRLEFVDQGRFAGQCFLSCHGTVHSPRAYPDTGRGLRSRITNER